MITRTRDTWEDFLSFDVRRSWESSRRKIRTNGFLETRKDSMNEAQSLHAKGVTPQKPKAETFPGLTPRWVSNPMYIVITVNNHYITYIWKFTFVSKVNCTSVIHISYEQKLRRVFWALRLLQKISSGTCLMWTWEYKQFENQHKAGEFISGFILWKCTGFL